MDQSEYITEAQRKKIWASARELGWDDQKLHDILDQVIGVRSVRALTVKDAALFIDYLV